MGGGSKEGVTLGEEPGVSESLRDNTGERALLQMAFLWHGAFKRPNASSGEKWETEAWGSRGKISGGEMDGM